MSFARTRTPVNMSFSFLSFLLFSLLLRLPSLFIVTATYLAPKCYPHLWCDVDPERMQDAINLIPDTTSLPRSHFLAPSAYRTPAIFEVSEKAQILIRVLSATGVALDTETFVTHLWPDAKQRATQIFEDCEMSETGLSGREEPLLQWHSSSRSVQVKYRIDMTCEIDKESMYPGPGPGVTTYTIAGIEEGMSIDEGPGMGGERNLTE